MGEGREEKYLDDAGAFVAKDHFFVLEMLIGAAKARVGYLDEDFIWFDLTGSGSFDDLPLW